MDKTQQIKNLVNWLDNSGIQNIEGGVYSWWDTEKKNMVFFIQK